MAFQIGVEGLLRFRRTLAAMQSHDYAGAAAGMRASLWARQTPARAERLARVMESGAYPA
jgi:lysozyme